MKILYRYTPGYLRSLVYLLQGADYHWSGFWRWWWRTKNFRGVARRGRVDWTAKARLMLSVLVVGWLLIWLDVVIMLWLGERVSRWFDLAAAALIVALPILLAGLAAATATLFGVLQRPLVWRAKRQVRQRLVNHRGIKIAVAGSYGKTTMKRMLTTVLAESKKVAAAPGNLNTPLGIARFVAGLKGDEEVLLFEFGEYYPGDIAELAEMVKPDYGVITGINEAHLERFKSTDRTAATIFELAETVAKDKLYVNADSRFLPPKLGGYVTYDHRGCDEVRISQPEIGLEDTSFTLKIGSDQQVVRTRLLGRHQLGPLAAAASLAHRLGLTFAQITAGLESVEPFDHRLQPRRQADGSLLIDDSYNGNPDGVRAVIAWLKEVENHRRIYVTPGLVEMGQQRDQIHHQLGTELAGVIEVAALIRTSVSPAIAAGLAAAGFAGEIWWFDDMPQCLAALPAHQLPEDIIVIQNDWPDSYA